MLEATGVGAPVAVHFDKELEEDLLLEEVLDIFAGLTPYPLERRTGFADEEFSSSRKDSTSTSTEYGISLS